MILLLSGAQFILITIIYVQEISQMQSFMEVRV